MRTAFALLALTLVSVGAPQADAHPEFGTNSIVNSASFMPVSLPAGKIAQGSIFTVFGTDMGPAPAAVNPAFPLATEIGPDNGRVRIFVKSRVDTNTFMAIPLFAGRTQVNAIMPSNVPIGAATITVEYDAGTIRPNSNAVDVEIVASSFGIFTVAGSGQGPAAINNFVSQGVTPVNSLFETALRGQVVILWGTGLGAIEGPDNVPPAAGSLPVSVEVYVGGRKSPSVSYAGRSPCCSGLDQIVFTVPADAPLGCYVPIYVKLNGQVVSNSATMAVSEAGGACNDPVNPITQAVGFGAQSFTLGAIIAQTTSLTDTTISQSLVTDRIDAVFGVVRRPPWLFDTIYSVPAVGSCVSYQFLNRSGGLVPVGLSPPGDPGGSLSVSGGLGNGTVARLIAGLYGSTLGGTTGNPLALSPGTATVSAPGGATIGNFAASVTIASGPEWSLSSIPLVEKSQGVTVSWTNVPGGAGYVRILGISESSLDPANNQNGVVLCTAPADSNSMFIPPEALANMPASATAGGVLGGAIYVGFSPEQSSPFYEASGVDVGLVDSATWVGRLVEFR